MPWEMSEKALNHVIKSNSDGALLEPDLITPVKVSNMYSQESTLKRTFTFPFRMSTRKKRPKKKESEVNCEEIERPKLFRAPSIRRVWDKVYQRVTSITITNKSVCAEFENRRTSHSDVRLPNLKLLPGDKVPGVTGLRNHGNTCFMNAVLQCLTHTDCLAEYFVLNVYKTDLVKRNRLSSKKYGTKGEVTEQLAVLLKSVWHCQYDPDISNQFKVIIDKYGSQYRGNNQHDAQEFLIWLLDKVHEDLNTATKKSYKPNKSSFDRPDEEVAREALANHVRCNNSFVHAVFQAQFRSSLTCLNCQRQSNTFDPFLCVSVPIPQQQKRPLYVTVLYISQQPRQVKLGLSLPASGTVKDLREQLSSDTGISESQMLLTQIDDLGFQRTFSGSQALADIRDVDPLYCIEMPGLKDAEDVEKYILLCWVNVLIMDDHCSRFGSPYTMQLCRLTGYQDIQKLLLKEMNTMLHDEILTSEQDIPLFRIRIVDGVNSLEVTPSYLDPTVDHPLYMEEVDQALALLDEDSGPKHFKIVLEWDLQAKESTIAEDVDIIEEHASVKMVQSGAGEAGIGVTLEECLDLYTRAEVLGLDDKWHCPFCNRKQQVIKKLGLWSLPDILVVHLKRFRQTCKQRAATKITTAVDCPLYGLDMGSHLVGPPRDSAPPGALWSPWRRARRSTNHDDQVYDLYAVCNHHGSDVQGGHYTAYCRNPYDAQWYSFDDTKVEPVAEADIITPAAYILFYQRRTSLASSAASSTSSGSSDHWVTRMPIFKPPTTAKLNNDNNKSSDVKKSVKEEAPPSLPLSITSPRPQRKTMSTPTPSICEDAPKAGDTGKVVADAASITSKAAADTASITSKVGGDSVRSVTPVKQSSPTATGDCLVNSSPQSDVVIVHRCEEVEDLQALTPALKQSLV